jgi:chorismate mutase
MHPIAIRGATTVNKNNADDIKQASVEMTRRLVEENGINSDDIIMVFLTMTADLTAYNAASAIRLGLNWQDVPFFTSQEPSIDGMLARCIRILVQCHSDKHKSEVRHVYLGEAAKLRPDLYNSVPVSECLSDRANALPATPSPRHSSLFTVPNFISLFRVLLMVFAFMYFLANANKWCFLLLTILIISLDAVDGIIARKFNQASPLGAKIDIFADRLVELAYWWFFAVLGLIGFWIFWFFLLRGLIVDYLTRKQDKPLGNSWLRSSRFMRGAYGTLKTLSFCLLIIIPTITCLNFNIAHMVSYLTVSICFLRAVPVLVQRS